MEGEAWEVLQNCQNDSEYLHMACVCPGEVFEGWVSGWMDVGEESGSCRWIGEEGKTDGR